jgi:uncharacterized protein
MMTEKILIEKLSDSEVKEKGIRNWPVWEKEISRFNWQYDDTEECLIIEGEVVVETGENNYHIKAGDFVTFQQGLKCVWDIKKPIRKYFKFK